MSNYVFPEHVPPIRRRILDGEPWFLVWHQQTARSLAAIARKTKIPLDDLISMTQGALEPDADQLAAIADALGVTVTEIEKSRS